MAFAFNSRITSTTPVKVILPFYLYAAVAFCAATVLLFFFSDSLLTHYTTPPVLGITHTLTLGWGTMVIFGASYQLLPVLIEKPLFSNNLAYTSFVLAALGIPLLIYGFFHFDLGWPTLSGGHLVVASVLAYCANILLSVRKAQRANPHVYFVSTASCWLLLTVLLGLSLIFNFKSPIFQESSWHYLPLHAHIGLAGWFLQLVLGVASRLIPMFLISKYSNPRLLWITYGLLNAGLTLYVLAFYFFPSLIWYFCAVGLVLAALLLFIYYCFTAFKSRIRKQVEKPMIMSLFSLPASIVLFSILLAGLSTVNSALPAETSRWVMVYGFWILLGWLTSIILGMTFKTLPFIIWNAVYHRVGYGKAPNPKDLFNEKIFAVMAGTYFVALILFSAGIWLQTIFLLKTGALLLVITAFLYNLNIVKIITHTPKKI
ncbi:MAG: cytochrome C oxidase subunit I [Bacteroidia bacterium]|nr:cytochrome C oxidase subunit I [Bacteroidia bacterium]